MFFYDIFDFILWLIIVLLVIWAIALVIFGSRKHYYSYNGHEIIVKAGWVNNYLMIDGVIVDEIRTFLDFGYLYLEVKKENMEVEVKIGNGFLGKTISTRINGIIVRNEV